MQLRRRETLMQSGSWPVLYVEGGVGGRPIYAASTPTLRNTSLWGSGRVWSVAHRVDVRADDGRATGTAILEMDVWTGDVLRVHYDIATGGDRIQVQECGAYRNHISALFKMALRVAREMVTRPLDRAALISAAAATLERRCARTVSRFKRASAASAAGPARDRLPSRPRA